MNVSKYKGIFRAWDLIPCCNSKQCANKWCLKKHRGNISLSHANKIVLWHHNHSFDIKNFWRNVNTCKKVASNTYYSGKARHFGVYATSLRNFWTIFGLPIIIAWHIFKTRKLVALESHLLSAEWTELWQMFTKLIYFIRKLENHWPLEVWWKFKVKTLA